MCFCVWVCFNAVMLWQSGSLMPSREVALELQMLLLSLKDITLMIRIVGLSSVHYRKNAMRWFGGFNEQYCQRFFQFLWVPMPS